MTGDMSPTDSSHKRLKGLFGFLRKRKPKSSAGGGAGAGAGAGAHDAAAVSPSTVSFQEAVTDVAPVTRAGTAFANHKHPHNKTSSSPSSSPSPKASIEERLPTKKSWLCRTKFFRNMIHTTFELVDQDGSGNIDEKELYSGLLLIHLKLGTYAGPAACKPISREKCHAVFLKMDTDDSGSLDQDEFEAVIMVLFGNVMFRVLIQYACTLLIVPMIAQYVLNGIIYVIGVVVHEIQTLDEHSQWADAVEVTIEQVWHHATHYWGSHIPEVVHTARTTVQGWIQAVPESVWNAFPLTLLSTILSLMLIPWSLLKIDDLFQAVADRSKPQSAVATKQNKKES